MASPTSVVTAIPVFGRRSAFDCDSLISAHLFPALLDFLTVPVSEMFRDPSYFRSLRETVIPLLRTYPSLKIWVAGCSTGEEVYSLAILLREEGLLSRSLIYATDINPGVLQKAAAGVYEVEQGTGEVWWSETMYELYGRAPASYRPTLAGWLELIHAEDRAAARIAMVGALHDRSQLRRHSPER